MSTDVYNVNSAFNSLMLSISAAILGVFTAHHYCVWCPDIRINQKIIKVQPDEWIHVSFIIFFFHFYLHLVGLIFFLTPSWSFLFLLFNVWPMLDVCGMSDRDRLLSHSLKVTASLLVP